MSFRHQYLAVVALIAFAAPQVTSAQQGPAKPAEVKDKKSQSWLVLDLGDGATVKLHGYVKLDLISNLDYDLGDTTTGLRDIGKPGGPAAGKTNRATLRETRIVFDFNASDMFARFEGDFYGPDGTLRLRHAYASYQGGMIGQNWSNFMSLENLPSTLDFTSSAGLPLYRVPQIRYTYEHGTGLTISGSVEEDVSSSSDLSYTLAARYAFDKGMVRASGIVRNTTIGADKVNGWGVDFATVIEPWVGGKLKASVVTGAGIADLLAYGMGGTAVYLNGDEVGVNTLSISLNHHFSKKIQLSLAYGLTDLDRAVGIDTKKLETIHLSFFYDPVKNFGVGLEYYTGTRTQGNGVSFDADRIQASAKFNF